MKESTKLKIQGIGLLVVGISLYIVGIKKLVKASEVRVREIFKEETEIPE